MNKKGTSMVGFPLGMIGFFILMLALTALLPIQAEVSESEDVMKTLEDSQNRIGEQFNVNSELNINKSVLIKVTYSFVSFITYSAFEVTKAAVDVAVNNPELVNAKMMVKLVIISILAPIMLVLFKLLVIVFILVKEIFQSRKEKRNLNK